MTTITKIEVLDRTVYAGLVSLLIKSEESSPVHAKIVYDKNDRKLFKKIMVLLKKGNIVEAKLNIVEDEYGMMYMYITQVIRVLSWNNKRRAG